MTTEPTPDLCCQHGDAVLERLDRIAEILTEIRDARRGRNTQRPPTREEIVRFARGGIVKQPEGSETVPITYDPDRDGPVITAEQARASAEELFARFRRQGRLK